MKNIRRYTVPLLTAVLLWAMAYPAGAAVSFQCPGNIIDDFDGDGMYRADVYDPNAKAWEIEIPDLSTKNPNDLLNPKPVVCMHLTGGDGFAVMADGVVQYQFGFADLTGVPDNQVMEEGALAAQWPAPTIEQNEGDEFYLTLTNVGMHIRPDLFDPHTVHYHGLPESSNIYDGLPESGIAINMGASLTYYYKINEPGTYMYHCHVEATEHMQMGMLGNLYVKPAQNKLPDGTDLNGFTHQDGNQYVYNDGDGSTFYDREYPIQLGGFDREFHDASWNVQPLPFAEMWDDYPMINGRGYPDTIKPAALTPPAQNGGKTAQPVSSLIEAIAGQRILLRISNLNVTRFHTLASSIPMTVVGKDAKLLRGPDAPDGSAGKDLYYTTNSVTLGGGESYDVILKTAGVTPGTYFLYSANLNLLSNDTQNFGGMMTEIVITP